MKQETIELLYEVITTSLHMAADTQLKFRALEIALEKYEPNLFQAYLKAKEGLKTDGVNQLNVKLLEEIRKTIVHAGDSDPTDDDTTHKITELLRQVDEWARDDES